MISYRSIGLIALISIILVGSASGANALRGLGRSASVFGARCASRINTAGNRVQKMSRHVKSFLEKTKERRLKIGSKLGLSGLIIAGIGYAGLGSESDLSCGMVYSGLTLMCASYPITFPVSSAVIASAIGLRAYKEFSPYEKKRRYDAYVAARRARIAAQMQTAIPASEIPEYLAALRAGKISEYLAALRARKAAEEHARKALE